MPIDLIGDLGHLEKDQAAAEAVEQDAIARAEAAGNRLLATADAMLTQKIDRLEALVNRLDGATATMSVKLGIEKETA